MLSRDLPPFLTCILNIDIIIIVGEGASGRQENRASFRPTKPNFELIAINFKSAATHDCNDCSRIRQTVIGQCP